MMVAPAMFWLTVAYAETAKVPAPDFGQNVMVFSPAMPAAEIQHKIDEVYAVQ